MGKQDYRTAYKAYTLVAEQVSEPLRSQALLGAATALAFEGKQPLQAAQQLAAFVDAYPKHPDAAWATRACANCLKDAGRSDDSQAILSDLLHRWPDSESSLDVVLHQPDSRQGVDQVASAVRDWIVSPTALSKLERFNPKTIRLGLLVAAKRQDAKAWDTLTGHIAGVDQTGQTTADALQQLVESGLEADAERLAARLISPQDSAGVTAGAREASCRWAGRTQRWSMLALASEAESTNDEVPSRTVSVERLFAEGLMQTGRVAEARKWWNHLVDQRGVNDFATLLRCAEAENAVGNDVSLAERRIQAAFKAADGEPFQLSLVELLDAELAIRRLKFEDARAGLERVVRSGESDPSVRARAQWLIGETYFLQRNFTQAVEAYRRVEGIDSNSTWVAAALIQAGKSFEQLGRTREAAVCYWGLVNRFAESPHVGMARKRLAAISPPNEDSSHPPNPTLRR